MGGPGTDLKLERGRADAETPLQLPDRVVKQGVIEAASWIRCAVSAERLACVDLCYRYSGRFVDLLLSVTSPFAQNCTISAVADRKHG